MPGFNDLDLSELDLKPDSMDAALLLETFNADEMDIWNNYNLFTDDNIICMKDSIKEENLDIENDCLSSICPNDLINTINTNHHHHHHPHKNMTTYLTTDQLYTTTTTTPSSDLQTYKEHILSIKTEYNDDCSSNSDSMEIQQHQKSDKNQLTIDTSCLSRANSVCSNSSSIMSSSSSNSSSSSSCSLNDNQNANNTHDLIEMLAQSSSTSSSSAITTNNTTGSSTVKGIITQTNSLDFLINNIQAIHSYPVVTQKTINSININQQQKNFINNNNNNNNTNKNNNKSMLLTTLEKKTLLPPSPPSSLGSDSESNHASPISNQTSSPLKSTTTVIKKIRHQPYIIKSSVSPNITKSNDSSMKDSSNNNNNNNKINSYSSSNHNSNKYYNSSDLFNTSDHIPHSALNPNLNDECWPFLCSLSKLPSSGPLLLTEEEKRTLKQENLEIPTQLPLSKNEEKILKKIRRKIKNKISAQESRRKKKEYVDSLEKRVDIYASENIELKKRLEDLEINNKTLLTQLQKMQNSLNQSNTNQFGTILMVVVLFFAVVLGFWSPLITKDQMSSSTAAATTNANTASNAAAATSTKTASNHNSLKSVVEQHNDNNEIRVFSPYTTPNIKSRVLLAVDDELMSFDVPGMESAGGGSDEGGTNNFDGICDSSGDCARYYTTTTNCGNLNTYNNNNNNNEQDSNYLNNQQSTTTSTSSSSAPVVVTTVAAAANNNSGRSKSGNAVELTKVRPFIRKLPINTNNTNSNITITNLSNLKNADKINNNQPEYIILNSSNDEPQFIILNLPTTAAKTTTITNTNNLINSTTTNLSTYTNINTENHNSNNNNNNSSDRFFDNTTKLTKVNTIMPNIQFLNAKLDQGGPNKLMPSKYRLISGGHSSIIKFNTA